MKINISISEAIDLAGIALAQAEVEIPIAISNWTDAKERFIQNGIARAWFHKSRSYWEHEWERGNGEWAVPAKFFAKEFNVMSIWQERKERVQKFIARLEGLLAQGLSEVILEDGEISFLGEWK